LLLLFLPLVFFQHPPTISAEAFFEGTDSHQRKSYGELAAASIGGSYRQLQADLASLTSTVTPDDVHTVRKATEQLRDMLDLFEGAYAPSGDVDEWATIRRLLNDGYTLIGYFQDLAHSGEPYTAQTLWTLRQACLLWKANYTAVAHTRRSYHYLSHPSLDRIYDIPNRPLSYFFWGSTSARPSVKCSGLGNVAVVLNASLASLVDDEHHVLSFDSIFPLDNHENFHDFRKHCRSIVNTFNYFPALIPHDNITITSQVEAGVDVLTALYDSYGALNDKWNAYSFAKMNDQFDLDERKDQVVVGWAKLKAQQQLLHLSRTVRFIQSALDFS